MKKILFAILVAMTIITFTACGSSSANETTSKGKEITCYLKWTDGEEELAIDNYTTLTDGKIWLHTTDGRVIKTHMSNVIIIEK